MTGLRRLLVGTVLATLVVVATDARTAGVEADLRITFTGSSTLHDFGGVAAPLVVSVRPVADDAWDADVEVPVASLSTDNDKRDAKMRAMLRAATHPVIRGAFRGVDPAAVRRSRRLPFTLTIGGVSHPAKARIHDWVDAPGGDGASFDADLDLSLEAFDLEPPTALLFVRVADAVRVMVHVTVRRSDAEAQP